MELLIGAVGFIVGLFLWSNIIGNLFATTPILRSLKRSGSIQKIKWFPIIGGVLFASLVLLASAIWLRPFFIGSLVAGVMIFFRIPQLKNEAMDNIKSDYPRPHQSS